MDENKQERPKEEWLPEVMSGISAAMKSIAASKKIVEERE